jgi:predicted O-methyltransferase YrrM
MKSHPGAIIQQEQEHYLEGLLRPRNALLEEMEAYSASHGVPSSDPEVAVFLSITARAMSARRALEIGTAIGYGAIILADAMGREGKVTTIDPSDERVRLATDFISRAGLTDQIEILQGKAFDVLPGLTAKLTAKLTEGFDLAYIDAVKEEYSDYLELILPLIRRGGVIIADNVLWKGQVATGRLLSPDQKSSTAALQEFNRRFISNPELQSVILPLGDGLAYGVKI